ncbi:MAG: hypothetical protein IKD54_01125, partial [Clostridia bacterium]|nr:hypothetical protein [Clostridia bacterium]
QKEQKRDIELKLDPHRIETYGNETADNRQDVSEPECFQTVLLLTLIVINYFVLLFFDHPIDNDDHIEQIKNDIKTAETVEKV